MNKLKELQAKCVFVNVTWNNEEWRLEAELPDGRGVLCEGAVLQHLIAEACESIDVLIARPRVAQFRPIFAGCSEA